MKYSKGHKQIKCYDDGGSVRREDKPKPPPKPKPELDEHGNVQSPSPGETSTVDVLRNRRREQEEALGLRDGGSIRAKPSSGVRMPPRETRPRPLPPPKKGPKPKKIGR